MYELNILYHINQYFTMEDFVMKKEKNSSRKKRGKLGKISRIIILVFCALIVIGFIFGPDSDKDSSDSTTTATDSTATTEIKPNTSKMVDDIARKAKRVAKEEPVTKEKRDKAVKYIAKHYPKYFANNKVMEKTMYYGYYLEYAYSENGPKDVYVNLGMDTYQVVKGVYRNVDKTTDDIVIENLKQIKEGLNKLGYKVSTK